MNLQVGNQVLLNNRKKREFGSIIRFWRRKDVWYFDVITERKIELEGVTFDNSLPCHIDYDKSIKLNTNKISPL